MELLPGESLRQRLRRDYRLEPAEAVWVARQTAEALAALHRAGFLHGDVKPDNLRLVPGGPAVLIDLGFAHRPGENAAFLREGYVLGTADYLAPELCDPEPAEDLSSDLFSLGVMLFEMLTGRLPYPRGSVKQTFRRHRCDPPADVRRFAGPLPNALAGLVERLLANRPQDRPRAGAVVQQLIGLEIAGTAAAVGVTARHRHARPPSSSAKSFSVNRTKPCRDSVARPPPGPRRTGPAPPLPCGPTSSG